MKTKKKPPLTYEEENVIIKALQHFSRNQPLDSKERSNLESAYFKICDSVKNKKKIMSNKRKEDIKAKKSATKPITKAKPQKSKKFISDRLRELKFYCPGDEAGELFRATCDLCYMMNAFESDKAELLFSWAEEQAEYSKKWAEENDMGLDDFIHGQ
jgi:hypothetical protein